jgi:glycosyltransferase involved in cell wall biosynthesis
MMTTIVVSPRERYSSIIPSLESLFSTIHPDVPVIVVEGSTPLTIRQRLRKLRDVRPFVLVSLDYMVTPNEARNIGMQMASTPYVVLSDNDIEYEPGWLEALERNAVESGADAVAPLIFIGPTEAKTIHHAGGRLIFNESNGRPVIKEQHRLMNVPFDRVASRLSELAPADNDVCEFHCAMLRKSLWETMGGFDERLITREQVDFGLRLISMGSRITFAKDSHVTYRAFDPFNPIDLGYHLFRWSDHRAVESMDAFEETWQLNLEREQIRTNWIANHRARAIASAYPRLSRYLPRRVFRRCFIPLLEFLFKRREIRSRRLLTTKPLIPRRPDAQAVTQVLRTISAAPVHG